MEIKSLGRSRLKRVEAIVLTGRHTRQIAAAVSDPDPTAAKEEGDSNRESEGGSEEEDKGCVAEKTNSNQSAVGERERRKCTNS